MDKQDTMAAKLVQLEAQNRTLGQLFQQAELDNKALLQQHAAELARLVAALGYYEKSDNYQPTLAYPGGPLVQPQAMSDKGAVARVAIMNASASTKAVLEVVEAARKLAALDDKLRAMAKAGGQDDELLESYDKAATAVAQAVRTLSPKREDV